MHEVATLRLLHKTQDQVDETNENIMRNNVDSIVGPSKVIAPTLIVIVKRRKARLAWCGHVTRPAAIAGRQSSLCKNIM